MNFISGSSGFLGKHLVKAFNQPITTISHERLDVTTLQPFEHFFFLSSYGNLWHQQDIEETINANLLDLIHIIKQASKFPFKSFIYISSSSVKLDYHTPYSRMKKAAEEVLLMYMEQYNLPICILRPFSITGVGEQKEHLIPSLIESCLTGKQMNFVPDATHDFIDVQDVVDAILNFSKRGLKGIFELGNGKCYSNQEVLEIVEKVTRKKANVNFVNSLRPYDNKDWFSTNYKARSWGWYPQVALKDSIKQMVKEYDK